MGIDEQIRVWARQAKAGERMVIVAEADGRGNAAYGSTLLSAKLAADAYGWVVAAKQAEDALAATKARGRDVV